ncbi:MAG: hypothetical protein AAFY17_08145, partial [Cyanobacteria bacterium J06642_11]
MVRKLARPVCFATLLSVLLGSFSIAQAAPDPLFEPVLDDIRNELPEGWQFRLPAVVPSEEALYPFVSQASDTELIVSLGVTPDCDEVNCTIGMIGATNVDLLSADWLSTEVTFCAVDSQS